MRSVPPDADDTLKAARDRRRVSAMRHARLYSFQVDFRTGEVDTDKGHAPLRNVRAFSDLMAAVAPPHQDMFLQGWADHLASGVPAMVEAITADAEGVMGWSASYFEAVRDAQGAVVGMIGARQDISERKAVEFKLIEQSRRAEVATRAKGEFLANMSHEIRTPLNGVLTTAQVMSRGALTPDQSNLLSIVRQSGQDLLHLLNDILDFSKIEAGKLELEQTEFDPEQVLEGALAAFAAQAERKDLQLWLELSPNARGLRRGDPVRVRQIVSNFVSNALKFTEHGGVRISIEGLGEDGREGLRLAVKDTGPGIPADKLATLFQKFSQVDTSITRRFGGTGLGLAICQELASLMQGEVWVHSREGEGSTFYATLRLPYLRDVASAADASGDMDDFTKAPSTLRVLAAEDNPTNQVVLSTVMQVFGVDLTLVGDGAQAVEAWSTQRFDVILMDVQMPVMDGVRATRTIRAMEAKSDRARTPIIALSANAFHHQVREYLAAGMDDHVAKPIELNALQAVLERVATPSRLAEAV